MRRSSRSSIALGFVVLCASGAARAQLGSGWVTYQPPSTIHLDGSAGIETYPGSSTDLRNEGASFTNQDGIETFALHDPISNRAERRVQNTYLTGSRQFEGEVRVSPPTNDESVMQVFGGNSGATTQMIRAYDVGGGTLRKVPGAVVLAENVHGVWIKVNVIHDIGANSVRTYINGRLLATGDGEATNAGNDGWYHKYGCYGTLRTGSAKVEWRNVKHFRDGTAPPADSAPPPSSPDAGTDATPPTPDAAGTAGADGGEGTGGSGGGEGTGGSGGGEGTGGSGGAATGGGTSGSPGSVAGAGRGGAPTGPGSSPPTPAPPPESGCACRTGAPHPTPPPPLLLLLPLLLATRRRR